jgi:hypothetical protein
VNFVRVHLLLIRFCHQLIRFFSHVRFAGGVAWAWGRLTTAYQNRNLNPEAEYRLLVLDKTGLTGDLNESFPEEGGGFNLYTLPRQAVKDVAVQFLPEEVCSDVAYLSGDPRIIAAKAEYRAFLKRVWFHYGKKIGLQGCLTGNYSFYAEREFAGALSELEIPFFALHKECVGPPIIWEGYEKNCKEEKGPFTGYAVTVYNDRWKQMMIRAGVAREDRIATVGCPRIDVYHRFRKSNPPAPEKQIAFFSFLPSAGLPFIGGGEKAIFWPEDARLDGETWAWNELADLAHSAIVDLARKRHDLKVVIKVKVGRAYSDYINRMSGGTLPENVRIIAGGEADQIIRDSAVIAGFNSTTLLEGIAAGKPVVVPRFAEAGNPVTWKGILGLRHAVLWADTPDEFKRILENCADAAQPPTCSLGMSAREVLDEYVGNADGKAGERMRKFVLGHLKDLKQKTD